jgi:hypothetical protein
MKRSGHPLFEWLQQRNPFYIASAVLVLLGSYMAAGADRFLDPKSSLILAGVFELYQGLVLAAAVFLLRKKGPRWDALCLLGVAIVFLFDANIFHLTFAAVDPWQGLLLGLGAFLLAVIKVWAVSRFSGLDGKSLRPFGLPWGILGTGALFLLLVYIGPSLAQLASSPATPLGAAFLLFAFPACFLPFALSRRARVPDGVAGWAAKACLLIAPLVAFIHFGAWAWIFFGVDRFGFWAVPVVLALLVLSAGPLVYLMVVLLIGRGWDDFPAHWAWGLPLFNIATAFLLTSVLPFPQGIISPFHLTPASAVGLGIAAYFLVGRSRFGMRGLTPAMGLLAVALFAGHPEILAFNVEFPGPALALVCMLVLTVLVFEWRNRVVSVLCAAAGGAGLGYVLHRAGFGFWGFSPLFAALHAAVLLLLFQEFFLRQLRPLRGWALFALLLAAVLQTVSGAGDLQSAYLLLLAIGAGFGGYFTRDSLVLAAGAMALTAQAGWHGRDCLPRSTQDFGVLFLGTGFVVLAVGFMTSFFWLRKREALSSSGGPKDGENV